MMEIQTIIVFCMELMGTVAFAASGAMTGINCRMDVFGVCVLGVITAGCIMIALTHAGINLFSA